MNTKQKGSDVKITHAVLGTCVCGGGGSGVVRLGDGRINKTRVHARAHTCACTHACGLAGLQAYSERAEGTRLSQRMTAGLPSASASSRLESSSSICVRIIID